MTTIETRAAEGRPNPELWIIAPEDANWKVQATSAVDAHKLWVMTVAYPDARDMASRLDAIFGWSCWEDRYREIVGKGVLCELTVWPDGRDGPAVTKSGMAEASGREAVKAGESDAFKRAAFKLGIGRNLYSVPKVFLPGRKQGDRVVSAIEKASGESWDDALARASLDELRKMAA